MDHRLPSLQLQSTGTADEVGLAMQGIAEKWPSTSQDHQVGVSENSVPLNPMVNDHYPVFNWLFHWEYTPFSDIPKYLKAPGPSKAPAAGRPLPRGPLGIKDWLPQFPGLRARVSQRGGELCGCTWEFDSPRLQDIMRPCSRVPENGGMRMGGCTQSLQWPSVWFNFPTKEDVKWWIWGSPIWTSPWLCPKLAHLNGPATPCDAPLDPLVPRPMKRTPAPSFVEPGVPSKLLHSTCAAVALAYTDLLMSCNYQTFQIYFLQFMLHCLSLMPRLKRDPRNDSHRMSHKCGRWHKFWVNWLIRIQVDRSVFSVVELSSHLFLSAVSYGWICWMCFSIDQNYR